MAYGEIKKCEFTDMIGAQWRMRILKRDYVGASTDFKCGAEGFELKYNGEGEDMDSPFKMSETTFVLFSESAADDTFIVDMVNADEADYLLEIQFDENATNNFVKYWRGVIVVDNAELADLYYPQPFKIHAIDGLSLLKGKEVTELTNIWNIDQGVYEAFSVDAAGGPTWGGAVYQHRSLVIACLRLLPTTELYGTTETFNWNASCWENTKINQPLINYDPLRGVASRSDNFYKQSNSGDYKYISCYDMLKAILEYYNVRLFLDTKTCAWNTTQIGVYEQMKTANEQYVRFGKNSTGDAASQLGAGTTTFNIGDIDVANDDANKYAIADSVFSYTKQIKEVQIKVEGGNNPTVYNHTYSWATNQNINVTNDDTPAALDYINTYVGGTAGDNFTFELTVRLRVDRDSAGSVPASYSLFIIRPDLFVKVGNQYMYYDSGSSMFKWSTSVQPVYGANNSNLIQVPAYGSASQYGQITAGSQTTVGMDPIPVNGQIEVYAFWDLWGYSGGTMNDVTYLDNNITVETDGAPSTWGSTSKGIAINLYRDGLLFYESEYQIQNKPGGTLVNGGVDLQRDVLFYDGSGQSRNNSIYTWDGGSGLLFNAWKNDYVQRWRNRNEVNPVNILPVLKGIEMIGFQPTNRKLLMATLYHKTAPTCRPFRFRDMFKYEGEWYVANGFTFSANDGMVVGEFMKIEYDLDNAQSQTPFNSSSSSGTSGPNNPNTGNGFITI